jgi:hypothetical protein
MTQVNVKLSQMREFVSLLRLKVFSFSKDIGIKYVRTRICVMLCVKIYRSFDFFFRYKCKFVCENRHACVCVCVCGHGIMQKMQQVLKTPVYGRVYNLFFIKESI